MLFGNFNHNSNDAGEHSDATTSINVNLFAGFEGQTWIAFFSAEGKEIATSNFTGALYRNLYKKVSEQCLTKAVDRYLFYVGYFVRANMNQGMVTTVTILSLLRY